MTSSGSETIDSLPALPLQSMKKSCTLKNRVPLLGARTPGRGVRIYWPSGIRKALLSAYRQSKAAEFPKSLCGKRSGSLSRKKSLRRVSCRLRGNPVRAGRGKPPFARHFRRRIYGYARGIALLRFRTRISAARSSHTRAVRRMRATYDKLHMHTHLRRSIERLNNILVEKGIDLRHDQWLAGRPLHVAASRSIKVTQFLAEVQRRHRQRPVVGPLGVCRQIIEHVMDGFGDLRVAREQASNRYRKRAVEGL